MADTQPGGIYRVGGKLVDAQGEPTKRKAAAGGSSAEGGFDVENATLDELKAEAERREVTVTRGDGKEGDPLKADFQAALKD